MQAPSNLLCGLGLGQSQLKAIALRQYIIVTAILSVFDVVGKGPWCTDVDSLQRTLHVAT